jgi:hypothetical protein
VDVHVIVTGSEYTRIYFALFYIFSVIICLNILIAIILEFLTSKWVVNLKISSPTKISEEEKETEIERTNEIELGKNIDKPIKYSIN